MIEYRVVSCSVVGTNPGSCGGGRAKHFKLKNQQVGKSHPELILEIESIGSEKSRCSLLAAIS